MATPYGGGRYEKFSGGAIFYSATTGAHDVDLATENEFFRTANEPNPSGGGVEQMLGLPTRDETNAPGLSGVEFAAADSVE